MNEIVSNQEIDMSELAKKYSLNKTQIDLFFEKSQSIFVGKPYCAVEKRKQCTDWSADNGTVESDY